MAPRGSNWLLRGLVVGVAALALGAGPATGARESGAAAPCAETTYRVRAGDTLFAIAGRFKTTVRVIARANKLDPNGLLPIGLRLRIPTGACRRVRAAVVPPAATTGTSSAARLTKALTGPRLSLARTGAIVIDLESGSTLYALNAQQPFAPASTEKLPLALTALQKLGPGFRTQTAVLGTGELRGEVWHGDLYLKGYGDPLLTSGGVLALARHLRRHGIASVTGSVYGDESFFDSVRTVRGWKAEFSREESPPLSALVVDRAVLDGHVAGEPALAAAIVFQRALTRVGIATAGTAAVAAAPPARSRSAPAARRRCSGSSR